MNDRLRGVFKHTTMITNSEGVIRVISVPGMLYTYMKLDQKEVIPAITRWVDLLTKLCRSVNTRRLKSRAITESIHSLIADGCMACISYSVNDAGELGMVYNSDYEPKLLQINISHCGNDYITTYNLDGVTTYTPRIDDNLVVSIWEILGMAGYLPTHGGKPVIDNRRLSIGAYDGVSCVWLATSKDVSDIYNQYLRTHYHLVYGDTPSDVTLDHISYMYGDVADGQSYHIDRIEDGRWRLTVAVVTKGTPSGLYREVSEITSFDQVKHEIQALCSPKPRAA